MEAKAGNKTLTIGEKCLTRHSLVNILQNGLDPAIWVNASHMSTE